jgi:hypothetical protein
MLERDAMLSDIGAPEQDLSIRLLNEPDQYLHRGAFARAIRP